MYDVIIIGAGPAGLKCAEELSKTNLKVLLLEQNKIIGPKICAGGITNLEYLPEKILDKKYKEINFYTPHHKYIFNSNYYTLDRKTLGQWQLKKLKNTNVEIRTNSRVTKIEKDKIVVNNKYIYYKHLVGADGSYSKVRKYLGLSSKNIGVAIQYLIPTKKYKEISVFCDSKLFHSWYAWIFPHKNYVSIGCGCNPKVFSIKKMSENFNKWLQEMNIDISKGEYQTSPINYDFKGYKFNNIFLIGDAAGLSSILTGEGIYQAFVSGEEIAKIIINKNHISKKMEELLKTKKFHNKILYVLIKSGYFRGIIIELILLYYKFKQKLHL